MAIKINPDITLAIWFFLSLLILILLLAIYSLVAKYYDKKTDEKRRMKDSSMPTHKCKYKQVAISDVCRLYLPGYEFTYYKQCKICNEYNMHLPEKQEARKEIIKIIRYMSLPPIKIYFGFDKDDYGDFDNDPQEYTQKEISKDYDKTIKLYKKSIKWYMQFVGEWKAPVRGNPFTVSIDTIKIPCPYCGSYFKGDKCKSCGAQKPIMGDEE